MTFAKLRSIDTADVYKDGRPAGRLSREGTDIVFRYDDEYLADAATPPLAWTIPKRAAEVRSSGESVPPFFAGLLPEGARLGAIVAGTRTSEDDHLTLLLAVGADTVGDVSVLPAATPFADSSPALDLASADSVDLREVFDRIVGAESLSYDQAAIPGVQPKVSAAMISSPFWTTSGPAILKLTPDRGYPRLVENEDFFLRMARACELRTPEHQLIHDRNGRAGLVVLRFDRVTLDDEERRLAQEDACQVMGVYPASKYRLRAQDVIATLAERCGQGGGSRPAAALRLLQLVAFSYLIGNGDLHGKNFSIHRPLDGYWQPTPAYDLVSTQPYLSWRDPMALDLYGRANRLGHDRFVEAGERLGLPGRAVTRMLARLTARAASWADRVGEIGLEPRATELLHDTIVRRTGELTPG
ncbi:type II toxin-antitoxin system HipA family toxin [Jiangella anatolica]|uniref:Type II toxin-antitoxin system HipA family toxin n=1 Tax=Jiangella anatolica TaxID=2670374 RepID=A0A2W2B9X3_9ACTN|nr:HipA domain-containing protein [Jiangella anatolica]PZF84105.1 type II toxin-antitoxin system HipA family toxin [Jiangella anatolica]